MSEDLKEAEMQLKHNIENFEKALARLKLQGLQMTEDLRKNRVHLAKLVDLSFEEVEVLTKWVPEPEQG